MYGNKKDIVVYVGSGGGPVPVEIVELSFTIAETFEERESISRPGSTPLQLIIEARPDIPDPFIPINRGFQPWKKRNKNRKV